MANPKAATANKPGDIVQSSVETSGFINGACDQG